MAPSAIFLNHQSVVRVKGFGVKSDVGVRYATSPLKYFTGSVSNVISVEKHWPSVMSLPNSFHST